MCGRCSLICPMGIDVAALIEQARHAMFEAGLAPKELYQKAAHQQATGQPEASAEPYREQLLAIGRRFGVEIPLDKPEADVMLCVPRTDIEHYPSAVAALARVMQHLGDLLHISQRRTDRGELRLLCGRKELAARHQPAADRSGHRLQRQDSAGPRMRSCLHGPALGGGRSVRQAAAFQGAPRHRIPRRAARVGSSEAATPATGKTTFHDPCQLVRKGGVNDAPRTLMKAMGIELSELKNHGGFSFCCGGGGGVLDIERAAPLRYRTMENKLREIDDTGARDLPDELLGLPPHLRRRASPLQLEKDAAQPAGARGE